MTKSFKIGNWIYDNECGTIDFVAKPYSQKNPYWIDVRDLISPRFSWEDHISLKNWSTKQDIADFKETCKRALEIESTMPS